MSSVRRAIRLTARILGRLAVTVPLAVLYTLGALAAFVVVLAVSCGSAVRLGWSDVRKRASDGAA